tara:strand:- start:1185 stop:1403 length:219 start_codon:yes stop_codon:yes gene_type:complete
MEPKSRRAEDVLEFLYQIKQVMEEVLQALEHEEEYEACADMLNEIKQTEEDIKYYERLIEISEHTGRPINHQ